MSDLGLVTRYLGVEFRRFNQGIFPCQHDYVLEMLREFGMENSKSEHVPYPPGLHLTSDMHAEPVDPKLYCQMVGKLIFLTTIRPDLSYVVSTVSRYMAAPQKPRLEAVKHILQYARKTADYGLLYSSHGNTQAQGFTDADWAACHDTRRSTGGYLFRMAGASITWQSKQQPIVSRSSTESEYIALSNGTQEAVWLT
jgi:hypothetical protein